MQSITFVRLDSYQLDKISIKIIMNATKNNNMSKIKIGKRTNRW
jgi:hypothetical protein